MATWDKVKTEVPHDPLRESLRLSRLYEYNENHDERGRFAPGDGGGSGAGGGEAPKENWVTYQREETEHSQDRGGVFVLPEGQYNPYKNLFGPTKTVKYRANDHSPLVIKAGLGQEPRKMAIDALLTPQDKASLPNADEPNISKEERSKRLAAQEKLLAKRAEERGHTSIHFGWKFGKDVDEILLITQAQKQQAQ